MQTKEWLANWKRPNLRNGFNDRGYWIDGVEGLEFGDYVDLSKFTYINATAGVTIEDYVQIGQHCSILSVSTIGDKRGRIIIGEHTDIGSHTIIMPGVKIGKNCLIYAYSYIDKDIPSHTIYRGKNDKTNKSS